MNVCARKKNFGMPEASESVKATIKYPACYVSDY